MLPIYRAMAVNKEAIESGSTKPCLMTVQDEDGKIVGDYVVKVFKLKNIQQGSNTNKEVYGSILATEFDLKVPKFALIIVDQFLIDQLNQSEKYKGFNLIAGTYFGSEYIDNALNYSSDLKLDFTEWELETIFAFDVMIRNVDRRKKKPNLFIKDQELYLIDHELSLCITEALLNGDIFDEINRYWAFVENEPNNRKHLFLEELRRRNKETPLEFDTFSEYLHRLSTRGINTVGLQLEQNGLDISDLKNILAYLTNIKANRAKFVILLKELVK